MSMEYALAILLFLLVGGTVGSFLPKDWQCHVLNTQQKVDGECMDTSRVNEANHYFKTKPSDVARLCVATLGADGDNLAVSPDYYYDITMQKGESAFTFGGVTYNMNDEDKGDYILLRLFNGNFKIAANVELGRVEAEKKSLYYISLDHNDNVVFPLRIEVLVQDGQRKIYLNGVLDEAASATTFDFQSRSKVGIALQLTKSSMDASFSRGRLCRPLICEKDGKTIPGGKVYKDGIYECRCTDKGVVCECPPVNIRCAHPYTIWTDPTTCEHRCIPPYKMCYSAGDPHYLSFDGYYYDFHGSCTYLAASCEDFQVYFKNVDLIGRPPTFTERIELRFRGNTYIIGTNSLWAVDSLTTNIGLPYTKTWSDGAKVEIILAGFPEIRLYTKGRNPTVRLRAQSYRWGSGYYINAYAWLHGSCSGLTEGLCGNFNMDRSDDIYQNNIAVHGKHYEKYDEDCPPPPDPIDPCKDEKLGDMTERAFQICSRTLTSHPFDVCNDKAKLGPREGPGPLRDCITDVCFCKLQPSCACSQFESYATDCEAHGLDLSNWVASVKECPVECANGMVYMASGPNPPATCDREAGTGKVRGCFCPRGTVMQNNKCIPRSQCQCVYEGKTYKKGETITKEAECEVCECGDAGKMTCRPMPCPIPKCDATSILVKPLDKCCPYCSSSWVKAVNPEVKAKRKQDVTLTCEVSVPRVKKEDIKWFKGGAEITDGISPDRLQLKVSSVEAEDAGTYTCQATIDGKTDSDEFKVEVILPAKCRHENGHTWYAGDIYRPSKMVECMCDEKGQHTCSCVKYDKPCDPATPVEWYKTECERVCVARPGLCQASTDPHYVSFDGKKFDFKGDCIYQVFKCDDVLITADHKKDRASTFTKSITISYKNDVFELKENVVIFNGNDATVLPFVKEYNDGSMITIEDVGDYKLRIVKDGRDPFVAITWDKASTYSIEAHGSCKGKTEGMCGNWNDEEFDDFKGSDGQIKTNPEEFGQTWALDDEVDCKITDPDDVCKLFVTEDVTTEIKRKIDEVLSNGVMKECYDAIGDEVLKNNMRDDVCVCQGAMSCACPRLRTFAVECQAKTQITTDGWELENNVVGCAPKCDGGRLFKADGPKPAPSCANPTGGDETQPGCFCAQGKVLSEKECVDVSECKCTYEGKIYKVGETYTKEDVCQQCTCVGGGKPDECVKFDCQVICVKDTVPVKVDGKCCSVCMGQWISAVEPEIEGEFKSKVKLVCKIQDGVNVKNVKWYKTDPVEVKIKKSRKYDISADKLTLTIKQLTNKKLGTYKCKAEADNGATADAEIKVKPPPPQDLIDPEKEEVTFIYGVPQELKVIKLGPPIRFLDWFCNGNIVLKTNKKYQIDNSKQSSKLTILEPDTTTDGNCIAIAEGFGSSDKATFTLKGIALVITIVPEKNAVECKTGKNCAVNFIVLSKAGDENVKIKGKQAMVCEWVNDAAVNCKAAKCKYPKFCWTFKAATNKQYVLVIKAYGQEVTSNPVSVTVV